MQLAELLESKFRGDIRFRGVAYLKAERVTITRVAPDELVAVVRDGVEFQTQLNREEDELRLYCNCSSGNQPEVTCKHLWATILAVDEGNYLRGTLKPGYVPPFALDTANEVLDDDDWDDDWDDDLPPRANSEFRSQSSVPMRPWEAQLHELRQTMQSSEAKNPAASREREIYYEIDVAQSKSARQLVIQTSQRQRRANGQWGKLKPLKVRPGRLDELEHSDDIKIISYLCGSTPERSNWFAQQSENQAAVFRYRVPHQLCELVVPQICATGRVQFLNGAAGAQPALNWDEGDAWELSLAVVDDDETDEWRVEGQLVRGDETLAMKETELLVPGGLVVTKTHVARLQDFGAFEWLSLLEKDKGVTVPAGEEHDLVDRLLDMPALPRLDLPEALRLEEVQCDPVPHLTIRTPKSRRWHLERVYGEVTFDYLGTMVRGSSAKWAVVQREQRRCLPRNRQREAQAWHELQERGFRRLPDQTRNKHDAEIAARDLGPAVRALIDEGWQVHADGKQVRQPATPQFRIKSGIDWFELHASVEFDGFQVSFPELLSALSRGDSTVKLDDGSLGILPKEWAQQYGLLSGLGVADEDFIRFSHNQVALLDALLASQPEIDYDDKFDELRKLFRSFDGVAPCPEPEGFQGELRGYQREGLGWLEFLQQFQFGGCLADDMGLGKTVQLLALLLNRNSTREKDHPSLVVVPKSLLFNWQQECERFTPKLKVIEYTGLDREQLRDDFSKHDIVMTTYGTLRRDIIALKEMQFDYVVLDEAQIIKNAGSQVAKAVRLLRANHRMALSGTPIENHLSDLWSIFEFLNPGMLGRSSVFKQFADDNDDKERRKVLARGLRPFIFRRTKREVASELPEKVEQTLYCDMGEDQRKLYDELRDHYRGSLMGMVETQGLAKSKMHVLEALLRLRQAACHPALLDKVSQEESSAKLDVLCSRLEEILSEGHKALVFSQFTSMLAIVKKHLDERGIVYAYLDGQTRDRRACVERFQEDGDCGVFLISLKAGGLGLNLTAADYVFILDPWWNPAVETQAIDRAHRVGQTRQVFAYRLICRDTVEEKIVQLQNRKRGLAEAILEADNNLIKDLSSEDLQMLLS